MQHRGNNLRWLISEWTALLALGIPVQSFAQATLTTPSPVRSQCVGADCKREAGDQGAARGNSPQMVPRVPAAMPSERPGESMPGSLSNPEMAPALLRMPEYETIEFEKFVKVSVGRALPLFGHEFFPDLPTTFAPVDHVPVRADYLIGPGDELLIKAWGKIDLDARLTVDRTGQIYLPRVGPIMVSGYRYDQLNGAIRSVVARYFKDFDLNVSMGQLRSMQIFVLGYARRPGTYTISSQSTLVNALFASGGPASNGSMRHVQLKRNNILLTDLDLYDFILKGDKSGDLPLQSGDVVY